MSQTARAHRLLKSAMGEPYFPPVDAAPLAGKPTRLVHEAFEVFKTTGKGMVDHAPLSLGTAETFEDAIRLGESQSAHRDVFFVRRRDLRPMRPLNAVDNSPGQVLDHFYEVKKSTKHFIYRDAYDGGRPVKLGALYSSALFTVRANASLSPERRAELNEGYTNE